MKEYQKSSSLTRRPKTSSTSIQYRVIDHLLKTRSKVEETEKSTNFFFNLLEPESKLQSRVQFPKKYLNRCKETSIFCPENYPFETLR